MAVADALAIAKLLDGIVITISYWLAWYLWLSGRIKEMQQGVGVLSDDVYFSALFAIVPGYLILYNMFDFNKKEESNVCR